MNLSPDGHGDQLTPLDGFDPQRRDVLIGLGAIGATVIGTGLLSPRGREVLTPILFGDQHSADSPNTSEGDANAHEKSESSEHHGVSVANFNSAIPVVAAFFRSVYLNIKSGSNHEDFGPKSFRRVAPWEGLRLGVLKKFDKLQYKHEVKDLAISYPLAMVLTSAAEATEHLDADEEAMFNRDRVKNIFNTADSQLEIEGVPTLPDVHATLEDFEKYISAQEKIVVKVDAQNTAIGTTALVSPFITATLGQAMNRRMHRHLNDLAYAKALAEKKKQSQGSELTDADSLAALQEAVEKSNRQMNAPDGYVNKTLTMSANAQAAGGLGDAPVWFFALRNGFTAWAKASAEGLIKGNATAIVASEIWLQRHLGLSAERAKDYIVEFKGSVKDVWSGLGDFVTLKDQAVQNNKRVAEEFGKSLDEARASGQMSFSELRQIQALHYDLQKTLGDMPRSRFVYRTEDAKRVGGEVMGNVRNYLRPKNIARFIVGKEMLPSDQQVVHSVDFESANDISEALKNASNRSELLKLLLEGAADAEKSDIISGVAKTAEVLIKLKENGNDLSKLSQDDIAILEMDSLQEFGIHFDKNTEGYIRGSDEFESKFANIERLFVSGNTEEAKALFDEVVNELVSTGQEDLQHVIRESWENLVKADTQEDEDTHHLGLGHAASEVFQALRTQILAASALASMIKKGLEEMGDSVPLDKKTLMVLGFAGLISSIADNVVAYVFAEDVLKGLYESDMGSEAFNSDEASHLKERIRLAALYIAILFGALSKIGNGPNFKISNTVATINSEGEVEYTEVPLDLGKSFFNLSAWITALAGLADNVHSVNKAKSEYDLIA